MFRAKRTEYFRNYKREWRAKRRAMGLGYIDVEGMSFESYTRANERHKEYSRTDRRRLHDSIRVAGYRQRMKDLYGGLIDNNIHARVKWLEAKNERTKSP